jgi:hypothetical protein
MSYKTKGIAFFYFHSHIEIEITVQVKQICSLADKICCDVNAANYIEKFNIPTVLTVMFTG